MNGHFEQGRWVEDPKPPREDLAVKVKIDVDTTKLQEEAREIINEISDLSARLPFTSCNMRGTAPDADDLRPTILSCYAEDCTYNVSGGIEPCCVLKIMSIDKNGKCRVHVPREMKT